MTALQGILAGVAAHIALRWILQPAWDWVADRLAGSVDFVTDDRAFHTLARKVYGKVLR